VREGYSGTTSLNGAKYWLTRDLGDEWGTNKKGSWVVLSFDPATTKEQRDALGPMIFKTYGLEWGAEGRGSQNRDHPRGGYGGGKARRANYFR